MKIVCKFKFLSFVVSATILLMLTSQSAFSADSSSDSQLEGSDVVQSVPESTYGETPSTYKPDALERGFKPYFDWKNRMQDDYGFAIAFKAYWLYQKASDSLPDEKDSALGDIYRLHGSWTLLGRDTGHPGRIEYRVEYRSGIGGMQMPSDMSGNIGIATLNSGVVYSPFDLDLSVFNWTQHFNNKTTSFSIGRLAYDLYLDASPFQSISRGFLNRAIVLNPAVATTGIGALGVVAKGYISDNIWLGGQIYDNNAVNGEFDLDTIKEGEWLKAVEIGWAQSFELRNSRRIEFTYWDNDARDLINQSRGSGWAVSAVWKMDKFFPFLRYGHSNGGGTAAKNAASTGFEYTTRPDQAWNLGFGWAEPAAAAAKDEYMVETSYKFQVLKNFSLLPDLQYIMNPANNPTEDRVWIGGLRAFLAI